MHWGAETITFARPIHWILARYGGAVVPFELGDVTSGGVTCGHRFLAPQAVEVADGPGLCRGPQRGQGHRGPGGPPGLAGEGVDPGRSGGATVRWCPIPGLLEENTFLVEYPSVVVGNFEDKFLALPDEVLITSMREHQRYFSLRGADGRLLPHFIAVNNTLTRDPNVVRQGHERVIRARLSDAMFFYQEDAKVPLENRVDALKGVVFHSLLGTSFEKMERFRELAAALARQLAPDLEEQVKRAATLCKADITTEMVGEFPSLQGVMGRIYAELSGEPPEVAEALFTHYLPRHADDDLPPDMIGALVGLADRLDTICGCFGVGLEPHGHRRPLWPEAPCPGRHPHPAQPAGCTWTSGRQSWLSPRTSSRARSAATSEETALEVLDFFQTRLQHLLLAEGFDHETITAVLGHRAAGMWWTQRTRLQALHEFRQSPEFPSLALAFKRVINIARTAEAGEVNSALFEHGEENILYQSTKLMEDARGPGPGETGLCRGLPGLGQSQGSGGRLFRKSAGDGRGC